MTGRVHTPISAATPQPTERPVLLAVATRSPWPVMDGYTVRAFNLLAQLSATWTIKLIAPLPPAGSEPFPSWVAEYLPIELHGKGLTYAWRFSQEPLRAAIHDAVGVFRPACALVWRGAEAVWFDDADLPPAVADIGDCVPLELWRGFLVERDLRPRLRKLREIGISALFARRAVRRLAAVTCAGDADTRWMRRLGRRDTVHLVSNGVKLPEETNETADFSAPPRLSFTGTLNFEPNVDAARFLAADIWPRVRAGIPVAQLVIAGRNPVPAIQALDGRCGIEVRADVPDMYPVLRQSQVSIAPMRSGVGVKNKVLEAWACARPAVLTPLAVNGLEIPPGHEFLVQSSADALAQAVITLLRAPAMAARLGAQARKHVQQHYSWETSGAQMDRLLRACSRTIA